MRIVRRQRLWSWSYGCAGLSVLAVLCFWLWAREQAWHSFGALVLFGLMGCLLIGTSLLSAVGALLAVIVRWRGDRRRRVLIALAVNLAIGIAPWIVIQLKLDHDRKRQRAEAERREAAMTPLERLCGLAASGEPIGEARLRELLAAGADIDEECPGGVTPLAKAVALEPDTRATVELFVGLGADVNRRSTSGWTALHSAAQQGKREATRALLERGADPAARTAQGQTPLDAARQALQVDPEIVRLLGEATPP
jgi:hypothetical protein